jgi:hypothetical protein
MDLKTFYVTFGAGTFFANYYQEIHALNEDIVRVYMNKNYPKIWSSIYSHIPKLREEVKAYSLGPPVELFYSSAEHI